MSHATSAPPLPICASLAILSWQEKGQLDVPSEISYNSTKLFRTANLTRSLKLVKLIFFMM